MRRFLPLLLACAASAQVLVLNDANLIDGTGAPARAHMRIVIRDGRIATVEDAAAGALPAGAEVRDLKGMTVLPGLFDAHVHLTSGPGNQDAIAKTLRFGLMGGVTSVRDMGGDDIVLAELAKKAADPKEAAPRIYYSTLVAGPKWFNDPRPKASSHGGVAGEVAWMRAITPESDFAAVITAGKATGATGLKIYADLDAKTVLKITAAAHEQGLKVWAHAAVFPAKPSEVVAAKVDVISHSVYLGAEGTDPPVESYEAARRGQGIDYAKSPVNGKTMTVVLRLMEDMHTILDETLFVTNAGKRSEDDPVWTWTVAITRRAAHDGIPLAAGTDSFGNPNRDGVPNIHREMELLVDKAGLTPIEAIHAATFNGARTVGAEKDYGTVEAGKVADLVILRDDPSSDIKRTRDIDSVIKGGVTYRPAAANSK
ncbi:MAG TPA: amidohydrolase family protein [Bryobacteraceae bacterium]|jgi:imidazolonepropionase-like amidohydrolase|nr:amidohydrolase family protein [Bryobacteraceae bacterium]